MPAYHFYRGRGSLLLNTKDVPASYRCQHRHAADFECFRSSTLTRRSCFCSIVLRLLYLCIYYCFQVLCLLLLPRSVFTTASHLGHFPRLFPPHSNFLPTAPPPEGRLLPCTSILACSPQHKTSHFYNGYAGYKYALSPVPT